MITLRLSTLIKTNTGGKKRVDLVDGINLTVYAWLEIVSFETLFWCEEIQIGLVFFSLSLSRSLSFASFKTQIKFCSTINRLD